MTSWLPEERYHLRANWSARLHNLRRWGWGLIPILALLALWEEVPRVSDGAGEGLLPPFSEVMVQGVHLLRSGVLADSLPRSLLRVLAGFAAGAVTWIGLGVLIGWQEKVGKTFRPLFGIFYPVPAVGWVPLLMLWLGISELLPIVVIYICSFFPVLYTTVAGVRSVDKEYIRVARSLGASERYILLKVIVPLALPYIFTGLRLEAGMAWRVLAAAEMIAVPTGLGALMMRAQSLIRMDIIIACLIVLAIMSLVFEKTFALLEKRLTIDWY